MAIRLNDNLDLLFPGDDGYIVDDAHVRGGFTVVENLVKRDALPMASRKVGMTVYVVNQKKEYMLQDGITNTDWHEKTFDVGNIDGAAKMDSPTLTGIVRYKNKDVQTSNEIHKLTAIHDGDSDKSHIEVTLTDDDKLHFGKGAIIVGAQSLASALILDLDATGIVIPSISAPVSKPIYRAGEFIFGEHLIIKEAAVIARLPEQIMTRAAVEMLSLSKEGGEVYGPIENRPIYRHQTVTKVKSVANLSSQYNIVDVGFTAEDKKFIFHGMTVLTSGGETVKTVRVDPKGGSILIKKVDAVKFSAGQTLKILDRVLMPANENHLVTKQYVDDFMGHSEIKITKADFDKLGATYDPLTQSQRSLQRFVFPHRYYSGIDIPTIRLFRSVQDDHGNTYRYQVDQYVENIRVAFRSDQGGNLDIVIEFWDTEPYDCDLVIY